MADKYKYARSGSSLLRRDENYQYQIFRPAKDGWEDYDSSSNVKDFMEGIVVDASNVDTLKKSLTELEEAL